ncbi:MAG: selenocysteine-specific translation elongation factor [Nitrospinae bacterium]|nr:selenocysteine-specific translation elongation factor [Nitrospinota bacterium]
MKHVVIGTAGHIDHGKTSLVKALTGTDTDRLKEEKERGITIELGFAELILDNVYAGIVDVPGHERFVKNMLAGVGGIDLVMLIVAADEGVMPQTREHLSICRLLGVKTGLIVLTKTDLVDPEWVELVTDDIQDFVKDTFLEEKPIVPVSAHTGDGLENLKKILNEIADQTPTKSETGIFRIPIDRVFTMRGFGVVITGTLFSGSVAVGEQVEVYPKALQARVRGLQVHGESVGKSTAGLRTAVNLQGLERAEVFRGDIIGHRGELKTTYMLDVHLEHLADAPRPLKTRNRIRFHAGTAEIMGRISLIGRDALEPGDSSFAQIRLEEPIVVLPRDRFVIRSYSPIITIGGGEILDIMPRKHRRLRSSSLEHLKSLHQGDETERLLILLRDSRLNGVELADLTGRLTLKPSDIQKTIQELSSQREVQIIDQTNFFSMTTAHFNTAQKNILSFLCEYHAENPLRTGAPREEVRGKAGEINEKIFAAALKHLSESNEIVENGAILRLASHSVEIDEKLGEVKTKLESVYKNAHFQPPSVEDAFSQSGGKGNSNRNALQILIDEGALLRLKDNIIYHRHALSEAENLLREHLSQNNEITAAEFRDLLGITRKHAIPLLEYFDTARITLRVEDKRVLRPDAR